MKKSIIAAAIVLAASSFGAQAADYKSSVYSNIDFECPTSTKVSSNGYVELSCKVTNNTRSSVSTREIEVTAYRRDNFTAPIGYSAYLHNERGPVSDATYMGSPSTIEPGETRSFNIYMFGVKFDEMESFEFHN